MNISFCLKFLLKKQVFIYALIGGAGTAVHYMTMLFGVEFFGYPFILATTLGFFFGAVINYILNYKYTFASTKPHKKAAPTFFGIAAIGMLLNGLLILFLTQFEFMATNYMMAQIITTLTIMLITFRLNKLLTF